MAICVANEGLTGAKEERRSASRACFDSTQNVYDNRRRRKTKQKKTNEKATSRPALGRQCSVRQNEPEFYATVWRNSGTTATDWRQKTNGWIGSTHIQLQRTKALEDAMDQSEHRLSIPKMRLERQVNVIY